MVIGVIEEKNNTTKADDMRVGGSGLRPSDQSDLLVPQSLLGPLPEGTIHVLQWIAAKALNLGLVGLTITSWLYVQLATQLLFRH